MTLDAPKSDAELLAMLAQKQGRGLTVLAAGVPMPLRVRIPWSALVSDNDKYTVAHGKLVLTDPYRAAKKAIGNAGADAMGGFPHLDGPLSLTARVWMPDNRPHDLTNFCKVVHDGLEKVVYRADSQLYDVRWIRAGVDVDAPRCELTISPL